MCGCPCNISVKIAYLRLAIIDTLKEDASIATERVKILEGEEQGQRDCIINRSVFTKSKMKDLICFWTSCPNTFITTEVRDTGL